MRKEKVLGRRKPPPANSHRRTRKGSRFPVRVSAPNLVQRTRNVQNEPRKLVTEKYRGSNGGGWYEELTGRRRWPSLTPSTSRPSTSTPGPWPPRQAAS